MASRPGSDLDMDSEDEDCNPAGAGADIVSLLFWLDCDIALQRVFTQLDGHSLKAARLVCRQWNNFIQTRVRHIHSTAAVTICCVLCNITCQVWGSAPARAALKAALAEQMLSVEPNEEELQAGRVGEESQVFYCAADGGLGAELHWTIA